MASLNRISIPMMKQSDFDKYMMITKLEITGNDSKATSRNAVEPASQSWLAQHRIYSIEQFAKFKHMKTSEKNKLT